MTVADPVVLTPALPRFLSPGDSAVMPVTAFNTTTRPVVLDIGVETVGRWRHRAAPPAGRGSQPGALRAVPLKTGRDAASRRTVRTSASARYSSRSPSCRCAPRPFAIDATRGLEAGKSVTHEVPDVYLPAGRSAYVTLSTFRW